MHTIDVPGRNGPFRVFKNIMFFSVADFTPGDKDEEVGDMCVIGDQDRLCRLLVAAMDRSPELRWIVETAITTWWDREEGEEKGFDALS